MEWVETTGRTVAEAKEAALDQLGIDSTEAEFEVVNEEKTSLFGRLKVEARVRARVAPSAPRSKEHGNRRKRGTKRERPQPQSNKRSSRSGTENDAKEANDDKNSRPPKPRRERSAGKSDSANRVRPDRGEEMIEDDQEQIPLSEQGAVAEDFLQGFFTTTASPVSITRSADEEEQIVRIAVEGENLGHLIGPRGTTLHSLQELTRTVVQRQTGSRSGRVVLDISGYREKRKAALEEFSKKVANEVIETGEQRRLEPMNPADRKIVHDTINLIEGIETSSDGEEPRRFVVIKPSN